MSHQKLVLSDLKAMPEFAAPVVQIDQDILEMVLLPIDPAVEEAAELREIHKDEVKAILDEAKNLLKVRKERVAILNGLCDEFDSLEAKRIEEKNALGKALADTRKTFANDPVILENKQKVHRLYPDLVEKWKANFEAGVILQTQRIAASNIVALKELDASLEALDKKIDALGKEVDDYKALATKLFAQADALKAEYGL